MNMNEILDLTIPNVEDLIEGYSENNKSEDDKSQLKDLDAINFMLNNKNKF